MQLNLNLALDGAGSTHCVGMSRIGACEMRRIVIVMVVATGTLKRFQFVNVLGHWVQATLTDAV